MGPLADTDIDAWTFCNLVRLFIDYKPLSNMPYLQLGVHREGVIVSNL